MTPEAKKGFALDPLSALAKDYAYFLSKFCPQDWRRLNEIACRLFDDPEEGPIFVRTEAAIHFIAGVGTPLEFWLMSRARRSPELDSLLIDAACLNLRLKRHFDDFCRAGQIQLRGTLANTLQEYCSHPVLFGTQGIEFELRHGEVRISQASGAPQVILGARLIGGPDVDAAATTPADSTAETAEQPLDRPQSNSQRNPRRKETSQRASSPHTAAAALALVQYANDIGIEKNCSARKLAHRVTHYAFHLGLKGADLLDPEKTAFKEIAGEILEQIKTPGDPSWDPEQHSGPID
jgi:hypothetical protein